jgi:hypothetical protein
MEEKEKEQGYEGILCAVGHHGHVIVLGWGHGWESDGKPTSLKTLWEMMVEFLEPQPAGNIPTVPTGGKHHQFLSQEALSFPFLNIFWKSYQSEIR